jgi:hypothetical protein
MPENLNSHTSARCSPQNSPGSATEQRADSRFEEKGASTPRRVIGFVFSPSSACSTPSLSTFDDGEGEEHMVSPFCDGAQTVQGWGGSTNCGLGLTAEPLSPVSRQASALTSELQGAVFESAMHRLRSLRTSNSAKIGDSALEKRRVSILEASPLDRAARSASATSSAMNIPIACFRARTAPDQLPELTESMVESLLLKQKENGSPGADGCISTNDTNKTPEGKEMCSPQRRKNYAGKRVRLGSRCFVVHTRTWSGSTLTALSLSLVLMFRYPLPSFLMT